MSKKKLLLCTILILVVGSIDLFGCYVAFAWGSNDYDTTPYCGSDGVSNFDLSAYIENLKSKNKPFFIMKYNNLVTNQYDDDYNKKQPRVDIIYPNNGTLVKSGNTISVTTGGSISYSISAYDTGDNYTPMTDNYYVGLYGGGGGTSYTLPIDGNTSDILYYWNNPEGSDLGQNDYTPPVDESEMNVRDIPLNSIKLIEPNTSTTLVGKFPEVIQNVKFDLEGKVAIPSDINSQDYDSILTFSSQFKQEACDTISYYYCGISGTCAMPFFEYYGTPYDWSSNGYITFHMYSTFQINTWDIPETFTTSEFKVGLNFQTNYHKNIFVPGVYSWVTDSNDVILSYPTDVDGDGVDDNTGEPIPPDSILNGDDGTPGDTGGSGLGIDELLVEFASVFAKLPTIASNISTAFTSVFSIFPPPIPALAVATIVCMIFISFIKFVRG